VNVNASLRRLDQLMRWDADGDGSGAGLCVASGATVVSLTDAGLIDELLALRLVRVVDSIDQGRRLVDSADLLDAWLSVFVLLADHAC
jgi:hypothetical protein